MHGAVFTAWLALFIAQTQLVAARRLDLHMRLGVAGIALAVLTVAAGLAAAFVAPRYRAPRSSD